MLKKADCAGQWKMQAKYLFVPVVGQMYRKGSGRVLRAS
jgi:hypothetical protein